MFKAFIFDMDGVLADNEPFHTKAWQALCERHNRKYSKEFIKRKTLGTTNKECINLLFNTTNKEKIEEFKDERLKIYFSLCKGKIKALKGLTNFLNELKENNKQIILATNGAEESVNFILTNLRIKRHFSIIISEGMVKKGKPDPHIYQLAAKKANVKPKDCLVFEDSFAGVQAAVSAGMKCVGVKTSHNKFKDIILTIKDFNEINLKQLENL